VWKVLKIGEVLRVRPSNSQASADNLIMWIPEWSTFAMLALSVTLLPSLPAEAQPKCARDWPRGGLNLAGHLEDGDIRAYLDLGYPAQSDDGVSGVFIYPSRWQPGQTDATAEFSLDGTLTNDCQMRLEDSSGGVWKLRFVAGRRLVGTREYPARPPADVSLRIVPATDCSGKGAWRTFDSPRWPITFDYPASWPLAENGNHIVVGCPDAARVAWGGAAISFQLGQGRENVVAADGRAGTRIDWFISFGNDQWLFGNTCDERPPDDLGIFCHVARQSTWRGMTVLQGSPGEHRLYRPGRGYVGQGGGIMSYAFLIGDTWVVIDSEDTPDSIDDVRSPGPELFQGTGVTERMVRSIKLR
jgi:hypothetical protein